MKKEQFTKLMYDHFEKTILPQCINICDYEPFDKLWSIRNEVYSIFFPLGSINNDIISISHLAQDLHHAFEDDGEYQIVIAETRESQDREDSLSKIYSNLGKTYIPKNHSVVFVVNEYNTTREDIEKFVQYHNRSTRLENFRHTLLTKDLFYSLCDLWLKQINLRKEFIKSTEENVENRSIFSQANIDWFNSSKRIDEEIISLIDEKINATNKRKNT